MTVPNSQAPADKAPETPVVDAFGAPVGAEEAPVVEEKPVETKPTEVDVAKISEELGSLRAKYEQSETLHAKKDADIRAMAEKIKAYEKGNGGAPQGGQAQDGDVPFKEIKTSKDLTEDEKDEMTDAEIKALDEMAELKNTINTMHLALQTKDTGEPLDVNKTVTENALALANNDADKANQIIEAFNGSKFNINEMTAEDIQKAVEMVATTVTGYKKPKEDAIRGGGGKPPVGGTKSDPYGVDAIVESVSKQSGGGTYSL